MYVSIDVGGTNTRVAGVVGLENPTFVGEPIRRRNSHDYEDDLRFMIESALSIADGSLIDAVGIGTPGTPNADKTEIATDTNNLKSWAHKPLVVPLSEKLGCPVYYDNDAIAAGMGEAYYGQTPGEFDYIIWGTGIGGADIRRSEPSGRVDITKKPWRDTYGAWEADCGGNMIAKTFGKDSEKLSEAEWEQVAEHFGRHLKSYIEAYRPRAIVFGGGLAVRHAQMIVSLSKIAGVPLTVTKFGEDSGLMGGYGLIRHNVNR